MSQETNEDTPHAACMSKEPFCHMSLIHDVPLFRAGVLPGQQQTPLSTPQAPQPMHQRKKDIFTPLLFFSCPLIFVVLLNQIALNDKKKKKKKKKNTAHRRLLSQPLVCAKHLIYSHGHYSPSGQEVSPIYILIKKEAKA